MSKYKLSPQEYRQLLSKIELDNITLVESRSMFSEGNIEENVEVTIKESAKSIVEKNLLKVYLSCTFLVKNKETKEENIKVFCKYRIDFKSELDVSMVTDEFTKILADNTVKITIWPYFRQELSDLVSKMNLPNFILPLKRR